ncbi:1-acyl-sn-glycerol-3-phosphate acyltransferase [Yoonia sp. I 8.24]|uniref:lysophospholipid acyltransferase family protein n=1 Tax=Yoonia sp. I 8.24 TaxID=1537229 RepID=UPI001EE028B0|nr:lysophospholipid acyltransferase family protein [Yoonia sp. I 8.24]MCG3267713.1 1-acyl-sn-glycerol-3-phosphate acyltransferase [Yoonia sp. I 8.24]
MAKTWTSGDTPTIGPLGWAGWLRVLFRAVPLVLLVFGGLLFLLFIRLFERLFCGVARPVTPHITQWVCRGALFLLGLKFTTIGKPMMGGGAVVANHASWLDIFALNARKRIYFVAKSEVAGWPGIGWLARATGTLFIRRARGAAHDQIAMFKERLAVGHRLLFFPEGTSTDGLQVLPFKSTLFAAFFDSDLRAELAIQPVTVIYHAPDGADPRFYGWWGDMDFGPHLLTTLAAKRQGGVTVIYHPPVQMAAFACRKELAKSLEETVRAGLNSHRNP